MPPGGLAHVDRSGWAGGALNVEGRARTRVIRRSEDVTLAMWNWSRATGSSAADSDGSAAIVSTEPLPG